MNVRVVSAAQAAELDAKAISSGIPASQLMQAAGRAAAALIVARFPLESERGVAIFAGGGNNGGDAWVVAAELAQRGVRVRVDEAAPAATPDALAAREAASAVLRHAPPEGSEGVIVDGLLGTGARGSPRGGVCDAIERIEVRRARINAARPAARVVALDIPSGVDATTGETPGVFVRADLTVTFGSLKRGLLLRRDAAGAIAVVDIGLGAEAIVSGAPALMDAATVRRAVMPIPADAQKGIRKRLVVVGGSVGMAGATILAARGALRSGIGMVKLCVARESIPAAQGQEPAAMAAPWPETDADMDAIVAWADVLLIGPGLGISARATALIDRLLGAWQGPVVLDADAFRPFDGKPGALRALLGDRTAVLTPHAVEFSRLSGIAPADVAAQRFDVAAQFASAVGATVLLKGVPTIVTDGESTWVSAAGTPVLATGGSGDVLGGIVATLLAQSPGARGDAPTVAAAAAWIHGRAAEIAGAGHVRGVTLTDVIDSLRDAWRLDSVAPEPPILAELPAVGEHT